MGSFKQTWETEVNKNQASNLARFLKANYFTNQQFVLFNSQLYDC